MIVVVDTNVMLNAVARGSPYAPLFRAIGAGRLHLAISASILLEYEEVAGRQGGETFASRIMSFVSLVSRVHDTVLLKFIVGRNKLSAVPARKYFQSAFVDPPTWTRGGIRTG